MVLIAGASSKPGQRLIPMLIQKGYRVRALTRHPNNLDFARSLGVKIFEGDLRQPETLLRACEGVEAVVSSVTAIGENSLQEVDGAGNRSLMEAAQRSGVSHFVFVSIYGAAQNHPVDLFRIKHKVEEYIQSSRIPYTILRPAAFMETWCARIGELVVSGKKVTVWGNGKNPISFIASEDVARFIVIALEDSRLSNKTLAIGGPQNLTFDEVVDLYERMMRRKSIRKYVSTAQLRLMCRFYSMFDETKSRFFKMSYELAASNWRVDMSETLKNYPLNLIPLSTFMEHYGHV